MKVSSVAFAYSSYFLLCAQLFASVLVPEDSHDSSSLESGIPSLQEAYNKLGRQHVLHNISDSLRVTRLLISLLDVEALGELRSLPTALSSWRSFGDGVSCLRWRDRERGTNQEGKPSNQGRRNLSIWCCAPPFKPLQNTPTWLSSEDCPMKRDEAC